MRTSISHPLQIAGISTGLPGHGLIGVTFCPGKVDPHGMTGAWNRDLAIDLDAVRKWGAVAVVTLLESHEFELLGVKRLGEEISRRDMEWFHLPIVDTSVPDKDFERKWKNAGKKLHSILRDGHYVLVHCRGGLGRAGTITARLLIGLGVEAEEAMARVRAKRPGAIENDKQEMYVLSLGVVRE